MELKVFVVVVALFSAAAFVYAEEEEEGDEITQSCLGCICDAASGCNTTIGCVGDVCGPFRITKTYWADGGRPSQDEDTGADDSAYTDCANDAQCAAKAVKGYMEKYAQDCNDDGTIDCNDYARIHHLGGFGCKGAMDETFEQTFSYCQKIFESA